MIARWFFCALSKVFLFIIHGRKPCLLISRQRPLQEPIVSCALGKLYNKDAILEYLLDKAAYGDGEEICGHIRSLKVRIDGRFPFNPHVILPSSRL